ncbi:P-loop NTPase fold protein [Kribbella sp. NPDC051620]|uniref:KAP family P-loop NTPase fold protein n=1 Tax=Kribbella sp. NPDC051620 TaxID=3364120 RepID=UPI0037A074DD
MRWFRRDNRHDEQEPTGLDSTLEPSPVVPEVGFDYLADSPIEDAKQDRFRRHSWAGRVAETIAAQRDASSLVVGIYGPWGDGKTSVLNLIHDKLDETAGVVPVRFNPWRLGDETEMFQGFFATLADALDEQTPSTAERVGQTLRDYGGLLVAVPVVGGALKEGAGAAGAKLSETSLAKERKKIESLLTKHGQRVVILIDDVDRLDKSEIQAMFRLVKVAADFKHTAYVLAFDHRVVASALAERYAAEPAHGSNFMDKIIQLPLHLPPAPPDVLRALALETIDAALAQAEIDLTKEETVAFVSIFDRAVGPRLLTPRAAKRYGNALLFSLPMIGSEVHPVDLMLIEAMRICYPLLYEWVRSHPHEVLGPHSNGGGSDQAPLAALRVAVDAATEGLSADDSARARTLLTTLLPRTESAWDNKQWPSDWDEQWARDKRIASKLYFRRYFTYTVPPGDVPDADLDALLTEANGSEPDINRVMSIASALLDAGGPDTVLPKLAARIPSLGSNAAAYLAMVITGLSDRFPDVSGFLGLSTLERAAVLVRDLLGQVAVDERGDLATSLVRDAQHLPFAVELLRWLRPQADHQERAVLSMEACEAAGQVLADRLLEVWCAGDPFTRLARKASASLHVCALYGDGEALRNCLRSRIDDDVAFAFALMRSFLGQSWSIDTGLPLVPHMRREGYEALRDYVDPDWLFPRLQQSLGDSIGEGEEPSQPSDDEDLRLADQYARIHRAQVDSSSADVDESSD